MKSQTEEIITKSLAIVALATLIFMALSFFMVPNEGAESNFVLKLRADEPRIKYVDNVAGEFQEFNMELYSTNADTFPHTFAFQVTDIEFERGSTADNWAFEFTNADDMEGTTAIYEFSPIDDKIDVILRVTFDGGAQGERVSFTISGTEDGQNNTRLSPLETESTYFEYLGVVVNAPYNPGIEAGDPELQDPIDLTDGAQFSVRMWNFGSNPDTLFISTVVVYQVTLARADELVSNENFDVELTTSTGAPYALNQGIFLVSGASETINGVVTPTPDNDLVPAGDYIIEITVDSANGEPDTTRLHGTMNEILLPDFSVVKLEVDNYDVVEGDTVTIEATIGIEWDRAGQVEYGIWVDDELIEGSRGTVAFTAAENTKLVSYTWKTERGDTDTRTITFRVDPDSRIKESNENNNVRTAQIIVSEEESEFPWMILVLAIAAVIVVGGAYWAFAAPPGGSVKIDDIILRPDSPKMGTSAQIVAVIRNTGSDFEPGDKQTIVVSFYEDYESIGERPIDLTAGFEGGSTREVNLSWEPASAGLHNLNVAVDINDIESDVGSRDVEIGE